MTDSTQPLVMLRGALTLSASHTLSEGDILSSDDIKVLGGEEIKRLTRLKLLGHRAVKVIETRTKGSKADKDKIADLTAKLEQAEAGDAVKAITTARDAAETRADTAIKERDEALQREATLKQQLIDARVDLKAQETGQTDQAKQLTALARDKTALEQQLQTATSERDTAQADAREASALAKTAGDRVTELEATIPALEKEKADAEAVVQTHLDRIDELESEVATLTEQVETLTADLEAATAPETEPATQPDPAAETDPAADPAAEDETVTADPAAEPTGNGTTDETVTDETASTDTAPAGETPPAT